MGLFSIFGRSEHSDEQSVDIDLLETLAQMQGDQVEITDSSIIMASGHQWDGGTHFANTPEGLQEAIKYYTYANLNPLE